MKFHSAGDTEKVETKGQNVPVVAGWDKKLMEEITCHFIMLYLIPLNNMYAYKHPNTKNNKTERIELLA